MDRGFCRLDRIKLIVYWRCGTGKIVNLVHFDIQWERDVVPDELKGCVMQDMFYIALGPGKTIVHTDDFVSILQQTLAEMTPEKAGAAGYQDAFSFLILHESSCYSK
jgi:hypothetical protein